MQPYMQPDSQIAPAIAAQAKAEVSCFELTLAAAKSPNFRLADDPGVMTRVSLYQNFWEYV